jgi:hypothetical protein
MTRALLISFCLLTATLHLQAQRAPETDSLIVERTDPPIKDSRDTVLLKSYATRYNPRKALLYAAVFPGAGQVYTKKYWKIPLIYGGMGAVGYAIDFYQKSYTKYKLELFTLIDDPSLTLSASKFNQEQLRNIVNKARRERDFMIIIMGLVYVLQIVDAHVDAHLKEFDLNPNLQVRFEPMLENDILLGRQAGISMKLRF